MWILLSWLCTCLIFARSEESPIASLRVYRPFRTWLIIGKARLGTVVHQKTAAILTFTDVRPEDKNALAKLSETIKTNYNDKIAETSRHWGGGKLGQKSMDAQAKKAKAASMAVKV